MSEWGSEAAAYQQIAAELRHMIETRELPPGADLPSTSELMARYQVSTNTVQKALRLLKASGLVASRRGKSVYVRSVQRTVVRSADYVAPVEDGRPARYRLKSENITIARAVPPDDIAETLGLEADEEALRRSRHMVDDGQVTEIVISWIPACIGDGTELASAAKLKGGVSSALVRIGFPTRKSREWVDTRMPTAEEARVFQLPVGVPVFRLLRLAKSDGDVPVEALEMVMPGDRFRLEYDLPVSPVE